VIANRVKRQTLMYQSLIRFLSTLQIPIVATIRDSQNYIKAAELGVGIHEMKPYLVRDDLEQWDSLILWLESRMLVAPQPGAPEAALMEEPVAVPAAVPSS
ncbi:MAG: ParA family protein, partial [Steroidobacteraceae bacterium]